MNRTIAAAAILALFALQGCLGEKTPEDHSGHAESSSAPKQMWHCPMHPNLIRDKPAECPICGMDLVPFTPQEDGTETVDSAKGGASMDPMPGMDSAASHEGTIVKLDPAVVQTTGVTTESVAMRVLAGGIRATGRIAPDESRYASVPLRTMGYVERLRADRTGESVRKGQVLAEIYSPDVVVAQEEFLRSTGEFREGARRRLLNWDVGEDFLRELERSNRSSRTFPVKSPMSGIVMEKMVVQGQTVMQGMEMFRLLDLSRVWVLVQLPQSTLARVRIGGRADVSVTGLPGRTFQGKVTWIAPEMDMETRTAQARIEIANTKVLELRIGMYAEAELLAADADKEVLAVPQQALIPSGTRTMAIVSLGNGRFQPKEVTVGIAAGGYVQILSGLREGDRIVTSAQFLLDSESNLRAALKQMTGGSPTSHQHGK